MKEVANEELHQLLPDHEISSELQYSNFISMSNDTSILKWAGGCNKDTKVHTYG